MIQDTRAHRRVAPSGGSLSGRVGQRSIPSKIPRTAGRSAVQPVRPTQALLPGGAIFHLTCTPDQLAAAQDRIRAAFVKIIRRRRNPLP